MKQSKQCTGSARARWASWRSGGRWLLALLLLFGVAAPSWAAITVSPTTLPNATVGTAYSQYLTASGGTAPYTFSVTGGTMPPNMFYDTSGQIYGTPTTPGTYTFAMTVYDNTAASSTTNITITVTGTPLAITTASLPNGSVGSGYSATLSATGGNTSNYYWSSTTLPAGLSLSGSTGVLSGTPTTAGTTSITFTLSDGSSTVTKTLSLTINPPPPLSITTSSLANGTAGSFYNVTLSASGGSGSYLWSSTSLPAGLSLSSGGNLTGTPTSTGTTSITFTVNDGSTSASKTLSLTIGIPTITLGPSSLSAATVGVSYPPTAITASGGTSPYTFVVSAGALPPGMSLSSGGMLSGTPTGGGTYTFNVQVTDSTTGGGPYTGSKLFTLTVNPPTITVTPVTLPAGTQGSAYSQTITASGGTASYVYAVTSGTLPTGLSLSAGGVLSGTPSVYGTFSFTVTATDSSTGNGPYAGSRSYSLTINASYPVANSSSATVAYDSTNNAIPLNITGGTPTSVAIASQASHGTATASGTSITYTPTTGYAGSDSFTYTASNSYGTSSPATVNITVTNPTLSISASGSLNAQVGQLYTQTFTFNGGTAPYHNYSITGIPAGLGVTAFNNTSIMISGTPTVSGSFTLTISGTDSSTGNGPFTVSQAFGLNVATATLVISPTSVPGATAGTAYSQAISTSGGISPYTYAVTSGALPTGLSLSAGGTLSGTPTTTGTYNFTITSTDASTGAGSPSSVSQAYTLSVSAPTIVIAPGSLPGALTNTAYSQTLSASGGTAPYTYAVTSGSTPAGLTLSSSGALSGTPTTTGTSSFTVTATDNLGFTATQSYNLSVALGTPTANADTATTLSQQAVSIAVTNNDSGTITSIAIASAPSNGTATVNGTSVIYTPTGTFYGTDTFTYTDSNSAGTSAPATVTVTVKPLPPPTVANQAIQVLGGQSVTIDATAGATGGPYTGAAIATAPTVGTATVSGTTITYSAPANGSGTDTFTYTLSNAYGTSAPATVTMTIVPRPDPTKDPEVMGVLNAQAQSARRFMRGQVDNFQARLENLHGGTASGGFQNNLSMIFSGGRQRMLHGPASLMAMNMGENGMAMGGRVLTASDLGAGGTGAAAPSSGKGIGIWASGALNFGTQKLGGSRNGIDFNTSGLTLGADTRLSDQLAVGGGIGFGHDGSDIGNNGSRSTASAWNVAAYASYRPGGTAFVDGVLGYQRLSFDAHRYVTVDGNFVNGSRKGTQVFGSISAGFDNQHGDMMFSPYGRLDMADAKLDAYTETGDPLYALHYDSQDVRTTTGAAGLRLAWSLKRDFGVMQPMLRLEYRHDFQGSSNVSMNYADNIGPVYRGSLGAQSRNHAVVGLGLETQSSSGMRFRVEYQSMFESSTSNNQSIQLYFQKPFD